MVLKIDFIISKFIIAIIIVVDIIIITTTIINIYKLNHKKPQYFKVLVKTMIISFTKIH